MNDLEYMRIRAECIRMIQEVTNGNPTLINSDSVWLKYEKKGLKIGEMIDNVLAPEDDHNKFRILGFNTGYYQFFGGRADANSVSGGAVELTYVVYMHKDGNDLARHLFGEREDKTLKKIEIHFHSIHHKDEPIEKWEWHRCIGVYTLSQYVVSVQNQTSYLTVVVFRTDSHTHNDIKREGIFGSGSVIPEGHIATRYRNTDNGRDLDSIAA